MVGLTFAISVQHKNLKVTKRRNQFYDMHKSLKKDLEDDDKTLSIEIPEFNDQSEGDETQETIDNSLHALVDYLQQLADDPDASTSQVLLEFCEISNLTLNLRGCLRFKEGLVNKKSGGRYKEDSKPFYKRVPQCCRTWRHKWVILTNQYLAIMDSSTEFEPTEIMMIDSNFHVAYGEKKTGDELGIVVVNNFRRLSLKASDAFEWTTWLRALKTAIDTSGTQSRYPRPNDSFAPRRAENDARLYNCAEEYFADLYPALIKAEREVFITDWWMTPEIYLKRPVNLEDPESQKYRLDNILGELARNGVKVYVLLWKEVEVAGLYNLSSHTKEMLERQSSNIQVIRHPRTFISFWSHHEKICVIDQKRAFVGGIDLCMGRFDSHSHPLKDIPDSEGQTIFPGKDYSNSRIKDFLEVDNYKAELIDRNTTPRMPWQDIHAFVEGESAQDLGYHFIEYWNHAKIDKEGTKNKSGRFLRPVENLSDNMDNALGRQIDGGVSDLHTLAEDEQYGVIGKDAIEFLVNDADVDYKLDQGIQKMDTKEIKQRLDNRNNAVNDMEEDDVSDEELDDGGNFIEDILDLTKPKNTKSKSSAFPGYFNHNIDEEEVKEGQEVDRDSKGFKKSEFLFKNGKFTILSTLIKFNCHSF